MRSKFQNRKFENLIANSESLQKTAKRMYPSFFDIPSGTIKIFNKRKNKPNFR